MRQRLIIAFWATLAALAVLSFGRFLIHAQTPEGQCELATDKVEHYAPCDTSASCMLSISQLNAYNRAIRNQAIYCPIAEKLAK